jgi:3-hydroxy acid dehydrogenase/malonic semialdehyde reductase
MKIKKTILITGASSGIGKACAEKFAANDCNIIITGRRKELLDQFAVQLKKKYKTEVLCLNFDIKKVRETEKAITSLSAKWKNIDVLVNNAGLALGLDTIDKGDVKDWDRMIDTNIKGLLYISRQVMPLMVERGKGHIINIGSIAGKEVYMNGNVYCATKHAVDALTKAMRIDLLKHGIKVTAVHPGAVETEFSLVRFKGDKKAASNVYKGFKPLTGADVAEVVYFVTTQPEHVCINDIIVTPTAQANATYIFKS